MIRLPRIWMPGPPVGNFSPGPFTICGLLISVGHLCLAELPTDLPPPEIHASAAILVDADTGTSLYEKNADSRRVPASTQKLLTALLVLEDGALEETVLISESDTRPPPTKIHVEAGHEYPRRQLLEAMLVKSGNDVAVALARDHSGSVEAFAEAMNLKAWELGCRNSFFINPNGLTAEGQYSSARDMSFIARAAYANPEIRNIVNRESVKFVYHGGTSKTLKNTNKLLGKADFCNGMKTGYTSAAGFCLVASGTYENREMIAVILGSTKIGVWEDAHQLLAWGLGIRERLPDEDAQLAGADQP